MLGPPISCPQRGLWTQGQLGASLWRWALALRSGPTQGSGLWASSCLSSSSSHTEGQPRLRGLTHIMAWIWLSHLGLTGSLVWVWHRLQGLDLSQRTHWTNTLSWTPLTFLPLLLFAMGIATNAVLLIKDKCLSSSASRPRELGRRTSRGTWRRRRTRRSPHLF